MARSDLSCLRTAFADHRFWRISKKTVSKSPFNPQKAVKGASEGVNLEGKGQNILQKQDAEN